MADRIVDLYWEGPFSWQERRKKVQSHHVIYSLHGTHHLYGRDVLLYIGRTEDMETRLENHAWWVEEEYDPMNFKVASAREYPNPDAWSLAYDKMDSDSKYSPPPSADLVRQIEALLILAHQPVYNRSAKASITVNRGLRVFNTGKIGLLHPELSYVYHEPNV